AIAASRPTPLAMASEPRPPPRTSATASPRARGRSLGPTRRTDMGYPLVRSIECLPGTARPQPDGPRSSTLLARALLRAAAGPPPGPMHLIVAALAGRARAGVPRSGVAVGVRGGVSALEADLVDPETSEVGDEELGIEGDPAARVDVELGHRGPDAARVAR